MKSTMNHYTQLTQDQRYQAYAMNKASYNQMEIANDLDGAPLKLYTQFFGLS